MPKELEWRPPLRVARPYGYDLTDWPDGEREEMREVQKLIRLEHQIKYPNGRQ